MKKRNLNKKNLEEISGGNFEEVSGKFNEVVLPVPTRQRYEFKGWYASNQLQQESDFVTNPASAKELEELLEDKDLLDKYRAALLES